MLKEACVKILGQRGESVALKIIAAAAFDPLYLWYLIARLVMSLTLEVDPDVVG